jgi:hypothetical protein
MPGYWVVKKNRRPWVEILIYVVVGYALVFGVMLYIAAASDRVIGLR